MKTQRYYPASGGRDQTLSVPVLIPEIDLGDYSNSVFPLIELAAHRRSGIINADLTLIHPVVSGLTAKLKERCLIVIPAQYYAPHWEYWVRHYTGLECGNLLKQGEEFTTATLSAMTAHQAELNYGLIIFPLLEKFQPRKVLDFLERQPARYKFGISSEKLSKRPDSILNQAFRTAQPRRCYA